jgi:hypothetical protein
MLPEKGKTFPARGNGLSTALPNPVAVCLRPMLASKITLAAAQRRLAGSEWRFHVSMNISVPVPPDCIGVLFHSDEELYARVPQLRPMGRKTGRKDKRGTPELPHDDIPF